MKKMIYKIVSITASLAMCFGIIYTHNINADDSTVIEEKKPNIGIDLNGLSDMTHLNYDFFEDWSYPWKEVSSTYIIDDVTFTLSNESGYGTLISDTVNEYVSEVDNIPTRTIDGVILNKVYRKGVIKLEISGLPAGTHTFTSWHSFFNLEADEERSTMTVSINGTDVATGVEIPSRVLNDNDAAIIYESFEVEEEETVTIVFKADGNAAVNDVVVINAFEINGVHPFMLVSNVQPENGDTHYEPDKGLSWVSAEGAIAHRVYFGTNKDALEYQDEIKETTYDLSNRELNHMKTYYWRIDEVFEDGTVVEGKVYSFKIAHLAFPTAEGYGRYANGGRGGRIIEVTTLEDGYETVLDEEGNPVLNERGIEVTRPIKGTLRWALEEEKGPRIVVFKVGGVIKLEENIGIDSEHGDVYIAGQTAPGDGITLIHAGLQVINTDDVIIRNIRVRPGSIMGGAMNAAIDFTVSDNSIIDHCSISWTPGNAIHTGSAKRITVQNSIMAESLYDPHQNAGYGWTYYYSKGSEVSGNASSYHHNLIINCAESNFSFEKFPVYINGSRVYYGKSDIRNNVIYNWYNKTSSGVLSQIQMVNNYYKGGSASQTDTLFNVTGNPDNLAESQKLYLSGNKMVNYDGESLLDPNSDDAWKLVTDECINCTLEDVKSLEPLFESYVETETADEAYETVVANVGANVPERDYIDSRYIDELVNNKYTYIGSKSGFLGIIDTHNDAEGYPDETNFRGDEAPLDTDHDGMPDEWELEHGLDPDDGSDGAQIYLSDEGYTNVELYLNELAGDPVVYSENPRLQYPFPESTATPEPIQIELGDVDVDGAVNATDALAVLKHAAKLEILPNEALLRADITEDGSIDAEDALSILRIAAKIE